MQASGARDATCADRTGHHVGQIALIHQGKTNRPRRAGIHGAPVSPALPMLTTARKALIIMRNVCRLRGPVWLRGSFVSSEGQRVDFDLKKRIERAAAVLKAAGAREVYVFGSAASGKLREDSDIDLAVSGLPPEQFFEALGKAGDALGRTVDVIDLDDPTPFTRYLKEEGELQRVG